MTNSTNNKVTVTRSTPVSFRLDDVVLNYVQLGNPVTPIYPDGTKDNPHYSVQVRGLNDETVADLNGLGFSLRETPEGDMGFTMKAYTQNSRGQTREVNVYGIDGNLMSLEDRATIGYGTKAAVQGYMYQYQTSAGNSGTSVRLTDILVLEKVERSTEFSHEDNFKRRFSDIASKYSS